MAIDSSGRLFVDQGARPRYSPELLIFDRDGHYLASFGAGEVGPDPIAWPAGLLLDGAGHLYMSDAAGQADRSKPSSLLKFQLLAPFAP